MEVRFTPEEEARLARIVTQEGVDRSRTGVGCGAAEVFQQLSKTSVGLAAEELAGAGAADEFSGIDDGTAAGEDGFGRPLCLDPLHHGMVPAAAVRLRPQTV